MRSTYRIAVLTAATVIAALGVTACGSSDKSGDGGGGSSGGGGSYVFLPKSLDNPYWVDARKGMKAEAKKLGVKAEFIGPQSVDAAQQVSLFESAIARRPDGIAVSANDPETVKGAIREAKAAGIPVIAWDSEAPGSPVAAYIGTDNVAAGKDLAAIVGKSIDGRGSIAVFAGSLTALNARQRLEGLKAGLAKFPDIKIITTQVTDESVAGATAKAEAVLQKSSDIAAMVGITGSDVPGVGGAVRQAKRCGKVKVLGFDVVPQGQELMKAGCVQGLIAQKPYGMTAQALRLLTELKAGKKPPSAKIDTGVITVTPESLTEFLKEPH
jgi:ABC-type sugar transport system substrate-binding protein